MFGLHRKHLALGMKQGDLLLIAADLLGQLLSKHSPPNRKHRRPRGQRHVVWSAMEINSSRMVKDGGGSVGAALNAELVRKSAVS